jgi:hypothetical protein
VSGRARCAALLVAAGAQAGAHAELEHKAIETFSEAPANDPAGG